MKRRILFVSTSTTLGGAEKTLYTLATLVDPNVCEIAGIVSLKPKGEYARRLEAAGHRVFSFDVTKRIGLRELQKLAVVIHETHPDLVHAVMYQAIQLCRGARRLGYADFKLISSPRVNYRTRSATSLFLDGLLKETDDLLITECEASREYLLAKLGYSEKKVTTIRNGVDIAGWPISQKDRARRRSEMGIGAKEILLGTVGRLDEQKGHIYLLEAVAKLRAAQPIRCAIVGQGPMLQDLQHQVRRLGLEESVRLVGEDDDIPSWLSAMDIFILPSLWEGLPNALLEAMAMGLPVVAAKVDGVPEAVLNGISGLLCAPKDSQAIYVAAQDLIMDANLRRKLGDGAKKVVSEQFRLADMIQKYEGAYRAVLEGSALEQA